MCPPCGLSVPVPFIISPLILLCLYLCPPLGCPLAFLTLVPPYWDGDPAAWSPCVPLHVSTSATATTASVPPSPGPSGGSGLLSVGCRGLAARWDFPDGRLSICATMACASSSVTPFPLNGGDAPSPRLLPGLRYLVAPSLLLRLAEGGLCRYGDPPPLSYSWPYARGALCCLGGGAPPSWSGDPPPYLYCMPCARSACCCPPPPLVLHPLSAR